MPATWTELKSRLGLGEDPDEPRDNILAGTYYLRLLFDRFGYPGLFAAYNAGPGRYEAYLAGRRALPSETLAYIAKVAPPALNRTEPKPQMAAQDPIFVRRTSLTPISQSQTSAAGSRLFVTLSTRR